MITVLSNNAVLYYIYLLLPELFRSNSLKQLTSPEKNWFSSMDWIEFDHIYIKQYDYFKKSSCLLSTFIYQLVYDKRKTFALFFLNCVSLPFSYCESIHEWHNKHIYKKALNTNVILIRLRLHD